MSAFVDAVYELHARNWYAYGSRRVWLAFAATATMSVVTACGG